MLNKLGHAAQDQIVVAKGNVAMKTTGTINTTGNSVNIADGQFGLLSTNLANATNLNNFIPASDATDVQSFVFVSGTPNSTNLKNVSPFGYGAPAYTKTNEIFLNQVSSVTTTLPNVPQYHAHWLTGFTAPTAGEVYISELQIESDKRDIDYTKRKRDILNNTAVAIPLTGVSNRIDYLIQETALGINDRSVWAKGLKPFVVFAVDTMAAAAGTVVGGISPGDTFNYMIKDGVTYTYTADIAFVQSLREAIANGLPNTAVITVIGTNIGASTNNGILSVGLNERRSLIDEHTSEKTRVTLFVKEAEISTNIVAASAVEDSGSARSWRLRWNRNAAFERGSTQRVGHDYDLTTAQNYNPISTDDSVLYTSTVIKYYSSNTALIAGNRINASSLTILLPATITNPTADANTALVVETTPTTTVTSLNTVLGSLLESASDVRGNIKYVGEATKAAPFV